MRRILKTVLVISLIGALALSCLGIASADVGHTLTGRDPYVGYEIPDNFPENHVPDVSNFTEFKVQDLTDGTKTNDDGTFSVDLNFYGGEDGIWLVDFEANLPVRYVFVKGGAGGGGFLYSFDPAVTSATGLYSFAHEYDRCDEYFNISHVVFYYDPTTEPPEPGSLLIRKFIGDADEHEIFEGVTFNLYEGAISGGGAEPIASKVTDENGYAFFSELIPGVYTLEEEVPEGYTGALIDNPITVAPGDEITITLYNQRIVPSPTPPTPTPTQPPVIPTPTPTPPPPPTPTPEPTPTPTETPVPTPTPTPTPTTTTDPEEPIPGDLPKTGGVPAALVVGLGALITAAGFVLRKKK